MGVYWFSLSVHTLRLSVTSNPFSLVLRNREKTMHRPPAFKRAHILSDARMHDRFTGKCYSDHAASHPRQGQRCQGVRQQ